MKNLRNYTATELNQFHPYHLENIIKGLGLEVGDAFSVMQLANIILKYQNTPADVLEEVQVKVEKIMLVETIDEDEEVVVIMPRKLRVVSQEEKDAIAAYRKLKGAGTIPSFIEIRKILADAALEVEKNSRLLPVVIQNNYSFAFVSK